MNVTEPPTGAGFWLAASVTAVAAGLIVTVVALLVLAAEPVLPPYDAVML